MPPVFQFTEETCSDKNLLEYAKYQEALLQAHDKAVEKALTELKEVELKISETQQRNQEFATIIEKAYEEVKGKNDRSSELHAQYDGMVRDFNKSLDEMSASVYDNFVARYNAVTAELNAEMKAIDTIRLSVEEVASFLAIPSLQTVSFCSALEHLGYTLAPTHSVPGGFKTNAPFNVIIGLMYLWYCLVSSAKPNTKKTKLVLQNVSRFILSLEETTTLLQKHYPDLDSSTIIKTFHTRMKESLSHEEPVLVSFLNLTDTAQLWFRRGRKDVNGNVKKRPVNFKPNPEPNWGPKKAR